MNITHIYTELDSYYLNLSMRYLLSSYIQGVLKLLHIIAASLLPTPSPLNHTTTLQVCKGHPVVQTDKTPKTTPRLGGKFLNKNLSMAS